MVHYFFLGIPPKILNFEELRDIGEFQIFQAYSGGEYSRERLNMLESSPNQKIVRTLYISKGYSMFGELIDYLNVHPPNYIPRLGIPFPSEGQSPHGIWVSIF